MNVKLFSGIFPFFFFFLAQNIIHLYSKRWRAQTASVEQKCIFGKQNICTENFAQVYS